MKKYVRAAQIGFGRLGLPWFEYVSNQDQFKINLISKSNLDFKSNFTKQFKSDEYDIVFLAVPEHSLDSLVERVLSSPRALSVPLKIYHFSGSYFSEKAIGIHPVYSFSENKKVDIDFNTLNWVVDSPKTPEVILSLLGDKVSIVDSKKKEIYHSYLSVAANKAQLLNYLMGERFKKQTGLSENILKELVIQSLKNELVFKEKSFSGPWVRDSKVYQDKIIKNLKDDFLVEQNNNFNKCIEAYNEYK